jgi:hypothetical protein
LLSTRSTENVVGCVGGEKVEVIGIERGLDRTPVSDCRHDRTAVREVAKTAEEQGDHHLPAMSDQ